MLVPVGGGVTHLLVLLVPLVQLVLSADVRERGDLRRRTTAQDTGDLLTGCPQSYSMIDTVHTIG